jgi:type I restriction enzyme M protein
MKKQRLLFPQDSLLPEKLPQIQELRPSNNLLAVFEECLFHPNLNSRE